jgi:uncharacterized protein Usg
MAVQNEPVVTAPGKLIIPPADAARAVWAQIDKGRAIRKTRIRYADELEKAREIKSEWVRQTIELLKSMFDSEAVAHEFSLWDARVLPEYAELKLFIEVFYEELDQRLLKLESIHRRIPVNHAPAVGTPRLNAAREAAMRAQAPELDSANDVGPEAGNGEPQPQRASRNGNGQPAGAVAPRDGGRAALALTMAGVAGATAPSSSASSSGASSESGAYADEPAPVVGGNCLLLLHGDGAECADRAATFVSSLGFDATRVQADAGEARAVVDELCESQDTAFAAIVLDSKTAAAARPGSGDPLDRRFLFQLGCCVGKLGPRRVCVLVPESVACGNEEHGVMIITMDDADGWQLQFARQLKRSGIDIDLNRLC